jgi:hypothetical protein
MNIKYLFTYRLLLLFHAFLLLTFPALSQKKGIFRSPVDFQVLLSANFGEIRSGHFHSGIDIKTEGAEGKNIYACADGYISRIAVSPGGFGKALYIMHPNGYTTVYGHLKSFRDDIEQFTRQKQYEQKSFAVNLFPGKVAFPVKKGDIIAFSGNTGSSSGPHLHFEVRESASEKPVNPLLFSLGIMDNIPPEIRSIVVYDLDNSQYINKIKLPVIHSNGRSGLDQNRLPIEVGSKAGVGVEAIDLLNQSNNRYGIYTLQLFLDENQLFLSRLDKFSFDETQYVSSYIDYEEKMRTGTIIEKTFLQPNNLLSIYPLVYKQGIIRLTDTLAHEVKIIVTDTYGNSSSLEFPIRRTYRPLHPLLVKQQNEFARLFPYQATNSYSHDGFRLEIPAFALYDTLYFEFAQTAILPGTVSPLYHIHNKYTPVYKDFTVSIRPDSFPPGMESKLMVVEVDDEGTWIPFGGVFDNGWLTAKISEFGNYAVAIDTVPPEISPLDPTKNWDYGNLGRLDFTITDGGSGIKAYNGYIDGNWVLFEYDQKNDLLTYVFDPARLKKGTTHTLLLTVTDERQNSSVYRKEFTW